jgi:hypothetical protein
MRLGPGQNGTDICVVLMALDWHYFAAWTVTPNAVSLSLLSQANARFVHSIINEIQSAGGGNMK